MSKLNILHPAKRSNKSRLLTVKLVKFVDLIVKLIVCSANSEAAVENKTIKLVCIGTWYLM